MLQKEKYSLAKQKGLFVRFKIYWLNMATASLLIVLAFFIGRETSSPGTILKYRTVYIKQPIVIKQPAVRIRTTAIASVYKSSIKKKLNRQRRILERRLASDYVAERLIAVKSVTTDRNLNGHDLKLLGQVLNNDPSPNVRLAVVDALRSMAEKKEVQKILINSLNNQNNEQLQTSIVDLLVNVRSKQALPQFIILLNKNTNFMVKNTIKSGIEQFIN